MILTHEWILLALVGLVGLIFNWLLILAIQRKTYFYHEAFRSDVQVTNTPLLRPKSSSTGLLPRQPLLPSKRSSFSTFDKHILAFLFNDILTCNFLLPLRLIDLCQGLPCVFFCFALKFFEKLSIIMELVILTLLIITSLLFFSRKYNVTKNVYLIIVLVMSPLILLYLTSTLTALDVYESDSDANSQVSCKLTFVYINMSTVKLSTVVCVFVTYLLLIVHVILLTKMKWAIQNYTLTSLKTITEASTYTRNHQQEVALLDQVDSSDYHAIRTRIVF